jgi:hypothetical protein
MEDVFDARSFTYSSLALVDADWLKEVALTLRVRLRHTVASMLEAGSMLAKARRRLGRDQWPKWLAKEAQVPARSAARLIAVANVFEKVQPEVLERCTPTALYVLAEPGTPQSLREYIVEQATDGEQITAGLVQEWLKAYRDSPTAPLKLARKDAPVEVDTDAVHAGENWRLLDELLGKDGSIHFSASTDADPSIADKWVIGIFINGKGERRTATHNNLERVLLSLCGTIRQKECPRCGVTKPLDEFSKRKDQEDGRNSRCLSCERNRVKKYEQDKRARAKMAG